MIFVTGQNRAYPLLLHLNIVDGEFDITNSNLYKPYVYIAYLFLFEKTPCMQDIEIFCNCHSIDAYPVRKLYTGQPCISGVLQYIYYLAFDFVKRIAPVHKSSDLIQNKTFFIDTFSLPSSLNLISNQ